MLETLFLIAVTGSAVIIVTLIAYARWHYGSLEKLGIPVIKPHFILGSDPDAHKVSQPGRDLERYRKYGPVFGVYEGRVPRVFILDPDMIRLIMVKDFDHFYNRSVPDWGHDVLSNLLDFLPGEKWKTVRHNLTSMFTSSRIRNGGKRFTEIVEKYLPEIRKECKEGGPTKFEIKKFMSPVFVEFTMDYFLSLRISGDIRENFVPAMIKEIVAEDAEPSFAMTLINVFPFILRLLPILPTKAINKFLVTLDQAMKLRMEKKLTDTAAGKDFIDVMISMMENLNSGEYKRLGINKVCVQAQAFEMFIAGYDSIIGTLSVLQYHIAANPEVQEKLLAEIDENEDDLPYLTACIKEAIRLSPSFNRLERICTKDWNYKSDDGKGINLTIPKGTSVIIPAFATNRNPKVFKDPEEFRPERYYKKDGEENELIEHKPNSQYAMNSFGHGPRNCIGMRMGIEMVKAGMARVLKEFKFEMRDDSKMELVVGMPLVTRYEPIYSNIVLRGEA